MMVVESAPDLDDALRALLASDPQAIADPFPTWRRLREATGTRRLGGEVFVTAHDEVRILLQDSSQRYSKLMDGSDVSAAFLARVDPEVRDAFKEYYAFINQWMVRVGGEEHTRLRRIAHRAFTHRRVGEMRAAVQGFLDGLLDEHLDGGRLDVMTVAYRLPLMVIIDLLGCPQDDHELIHGWSVKIGNHLNRDDEGTLLEAVDAIRAFRDYVDGLVAERRRVPGGDDLVSALIDAEAEERLTATEVTAMFVLLLFAGHETTANLIGHGVHGLLEQRERWEQLCADPSRAADATEELLRFVSPVQWVTRVVAEDHEVAGHQVRAGDLVHAVLAAANRDPAAFPRPDEIDFDRPRARQHLAFGFGWRFCLGASLARLEGEVAFGTLARRFPRMELTGNDLTYTSNAVLRRLTALPVTTGGEIAV